MEIPSMVREIVDQIHTHGGHCYLVGGYVRDQKLGYPSKDIDIEIHDIETSNFEKILAEFGEIDLVGKSFGVYKLKSLDVDWSFPRTEKSIGFGHTDFEISVDPYLSIKDALRRRDFTINAMAISLKNDKLIDPFNGKVDLYFRELKYVDKDTFKEDPLRVLRGAQFLARIKNSIASLELISLAEQMREEYYFLPKERVFEELKKLLLKGVKPSRGIKFLQKTGWLGHWPEINQLFLVPQNPEWHPEGNVGNHTMDVIDRAAKIRDKLPEEDRLAYMLACLLHDVGKIHTTTLTDGKITSFQHGKVGSKMIPRIMKRWTDSEKLIDKVSALVGNHMFIHDADKAKLTAYRKLRTKVDPYLLGKVGEADHADQETLVTYYKMIKKAEQEIANPKGYIVTGKDLLNRGMKPGREFGEIIRTAQEYYLETGETNPDTILKAILKD